jgi:RNA recognition motif-containing protein
VGGIDDTIEEEELKNEMSKYGKIKAVKMVSR